MDGIDLYSFSNALNQWRNIARDNGWGDAFHNRTASFTVWVNPNGTLADSVATNDGHGKLYIIPVNDDSEDELEDFES